MNLDMRIRVLDILRDSPTVFALVLPPETEVGTFWTHTYHSTETEQAHHLEQHHVVVERRDERLVVERVLESGGITFVEAWLVDPRADLRAATPEEPVANVTRAWVGLPGEVPHSRPVIEAAPTDPQVVNTLCGCVTVVTPGSSLDGPLRLGSAARPRSTPQCRRASDLWPYDAVDIEQAGRHWKAHRYTLVNQGWTWVEPKSLLLLRYERPQATFELTGYGVAEPRSLLDWSGAR